VVAQIFVAQRVGLVLGVVEDVGAAREAAARFAERLRFDQDVGAGLLGDGDDFERRAPGDRLLVGVLPARHRGREFVGKAEQQAGAVLEHAMGKQPAGLALALDALDVVEVLERRLGAPAQIERREHVARRPVEDLLHFRPEGFVADPRLQRVDAGDDEAVELVVADVAQRIVELDDVLGRRVAALMAVADGADVAVGGDEGQIDLQRRAAEPGGELALGRHLVGHQVEDRDVKRPNVLMQRAALVDCRAGRERGQEGMGFRGSDDDGQ
jgi:hypothetical protein